MNLYPLLRRSPEIDALAAQLASSTIEQCNDRRALKHKRAEYLPVGASSKASETHLREVAEKLTEVAMKHGYPKEKGRNTAADGEWAECLHRELRLTPHHAAYDDVWHFFTVVLVPDLVRWRWGASDEGQEVSDRWLTVDRRGRNTFGRLWWRAEVLKMASPTDPYYLIRELSEDEHVQIIERRSLAGNRRLAQTTALCLLAFCKSHPDTNRVELLRDSQKRILRLGAFLEFQASGDDELRRTIAQAIADGARALDAKQG